MILNFPATFLCFSLISPAPKLTLIPSKPFFSIFSKKAFCNQNKDQQWENTISKMEFETG